MKFAFVSPRYGADIGSGADHACRLLAERVCERHDVDVLTTCARDHRTWKNEYSEGSDRVRGVLVRRFGVSQLPDHIGFDTLSQRLQTSPHSRAEELEWVRLHGPWSPGLLDYLKRTHRSYDALVFFGLWHPLTVHGIETAPERTVLFPYLQLQPALRFGLWPDLMRSARALGFFSESERRLLHAYVGLRHPCEEVVGIVQLRPGAALDAADLREFAARAIARFKAPRAIAFCEAVRRHANGKPDYAWARSVAAHAAAATAKTSVDGSPS